MTSSRTRITSASVVNFLNHLENDQIRKDSFILKKILTDITGCEPKMWGKSIIGFGSYHYRYESGHEGDSCLVGLSPKKHRITLYLAPGFTEETKALERLGKYKAGKGCLYIKNIEDINIKALKEVVKDSILLIQKRFGLA